MRFLFNFKKSSICKKSSKNKWKQSKNDFKKIKGRKR